MKQTQTQKLIVESRQQNKDKLLRVYNQLKEEMNEARGEETLRKWRILSRAYKVGKELYGFKFTVVQLSADFNIPYTTTKRCLSLDKANEKTWWLINTGKISAYKVAQILSTKNTDYQDTLIGAVINKDLSTYDIKDIKPINTENIMKAKFDRAIKDGYAKEINAFLSYKNTIVRVNKFLDYPLERINSKNRRELMLLLTILKNKLSRSILKYRSELIKLEHAKEIKP